MNVGQLGLLHRLAETWYRYDFPLNKALRHYFYDASPRLLALSLKIHFSSQERADADAADDDDVSEPQLVEMQEQSSDCLIHQSQCTETDTPRQEECVLAAMLTGSSSWSTLCVVMFR
jgi:hypothetical protein